MMESWMEYLAYLGRKDLPLSLQDFERVFQNQKNIRHAEDISKYLSHLELKLYTSTQKTWWKQAEKTKKEIEALGVKTVWPFHPDYPPALFKMENPPLRISVKGQLCWPDHFLFSIVGSREPYEDTLNWMELHLSTFLKNKKICIMSGGARGVDQKAHALSLASGNPTLCFLPCGIQNYYPSNIKKWEKYILDGGGALVSVFPFSDPMRKSHFHIRNRVLAYLSNLVFIAQAQLRSGTMVTARYALHAGSTIAALPGHPLQVGYKGNLSLINDGCFMIRDHLDLEILYQSCKTQSLAQTKAHDLL